MFPKIVNYRHISEITLRHIVRFVKQKKLNLKKGTPNS